LVKTYTKLLELYITLAASLANRVSSGSKQSYLDAATTGWNWFFNSGLVRSDWLVVDGLDVNSCSPTGNKYSYNQGVILSAAVELYKATGNSTYLELAGNIANATITSNSTLTNSNGVIKCDSPCDDQAAMFKGPFFRGLRQLQTVSPNDNWKNFITVNAQSIWNNDLNISVVNGNTECNTGADFSGPVGSVNEITQGAALDALVAAWAVTS
jgi:predicted alpha-1,6-mannanase (GH76 family)